MLQPIVRIALRYGAGIIAGAATGDMLANDPDVVNVVTLTLSALIAAVTDWWYARARKSGGPT